MVAGRISADWNGSESKDGWTLIRAGGTIAPKPIHFDDLPGLLADLRGVGWIAQKRMAISLRARRGIWLPVAGISTLTAVIRSGRSSAASSVSYVHPTGPVAPWHEGWRLVPSSPPALRRRIEDRFFGGPLPLTIAGARPNLAQLRLCADVY